MIEIYEIVLMLCLSKNECILFRQQLEADACIEQMLRANGEDSKYRRVWVDGWGPESPHLKQPAVCLYKGSVKDAN